MKVRMAMFAISLEGYRWLTPHNWFHWPSHAVRGVCQKPQIARRYSELHGTTESAEENHNLFVSIKCELLIIHIGRILQHVSATKISSEGQEKQKNLWRSCHRRCLHMAPMVHVLLVLKFEEVCRQILVVPTSFRHQPETKNSQQTLSELHSVSTRCIYVHTGAGKIKLVCLWASACFNEHTGSILRFAFKRTLRRSSRFHRNISRQRRSRRVRRPVRGGSGRWTDDRCSSALCCRNRTDVSWWVCLERRNWWTVFVSLSHLPWVLWNDRLIGMPRLQGFSAHSTRSWVHFEVLRSETKLMVKNHRMSQTGKDLPEHGHQMILGRFTPRVKLPAEPGWQLTGLKSKVVLLEVTQLDVVFSCKGNREWTAARENITTPNKVVLFVKHSYVSTLCCLFAMQTGIKWHSLQWKI